MVENWVMFAGTGASCINYAVTPTFPSPSVCSKEGFLQWNIRRWIVSN